MERLMDIYDQIENPLDNKEKFNNIFENALKVDRRRGNGIYGFYDEICKINTFSKKKKENEKDKKEFFERNNNKWKKSHPDSKETDPNKIAREWIHNQQNVFNHIYSRKINNKTKKEEGLEKTRHRFYININFDYIYKFMNLFIEKCEKNNLPFYFKYSCKMLRNDMIIIYSNTLYLEKYLKVLREIGKEYPEMISKTGKPPILTGVIDNWIGYGSEPQKIKSSYNKELSYKVGIAIQNEVANIFKENENEYITTRTGKKYTLKEYLARKVAEKTFEEKYKNKYPEKEAKEKLMQIAVNNSDRIFEYIVDLYSGNEEKKYSKGISDENYQYFISKLSIKDSAIEIISKIIRKSPNLENRIKQSIAEKVKNSGYIPEKICFDESVVQNMKDYDKAVEKHNQKKTAFPKIDKDLYEKLEKIKKELHEENAFEKIRREDNDDHAIMYNPNNNELRDMFASPVNDKENEGKRRIS